MEASVAPLLAPPSVEAAFVEYLERGDHPEVCDFEARLGGGLTSTVGHPRNVWDFVEHADQGTGGFANGDYLYPFPMELEDEVPGQLQQRNPYMERRKIATYDAFPGDIVSATWDLIASKSDNVKRILDRRAEEWAQNVDGNGTTLFQYVETPHRESRRTGVAWVCVDRPAVPLYSAGDDARPENAPYPYTIPTRNVRRWNFDPQGRLLDCVVLEPRPGRESDPQPPVRVWALEGWAIFEPIKGADLKKRAGWLVQQTAPLVLGRVPIVRLPNDQPKDGASGLGQTEFVKVARLGQDVMNMDSEARAIERKAAAPIFVIPVKDIGAYTAGSPIVAGLDAAIAFDGESGAPDWVQPDLTVLQRYDERIEKKKVSAYRMAQLLGLYGTSSPSGQTVQTKSGYHAEVEFSKTDRRMARLAANAAAFEREVLVLVLMWYGAREQDARKAVEITYPKEFGIRDLDKLLERTVLELETVQSEEGQRAILDEYFHVRFPNKKPDELQALVDAEMKKRASLESKMDKLAKQAAAAQAKASDFAGQRQEPPVGV